MIEDGKKKWVNYCYVNTIKDMKPHYLQSADILRSFFERNRQLLDMNGISANRQLIELNEIYGIKVNPGLLSEYAKGKRYRAGWLFIVSVKCYWLNKGYEIKID